MPPALLLRRSLRLWSVGFSCLLPGLGGAVAGRPVAAPASGPAPASVPAREPSVEPADVAAGPSFTSLAPRPCPLAGDEASGWRDALAALRTHQADVAGLPSDRAALAPLYVALAVAHDHACAASAPDEGELARARDALRAEGSAALKDTLRGLLALSLEQAGRSADAAAFWGELRAAERPSEWLVRAWLATGDARGGGELAYSATQLYERALAAGNTSARCYAAWRLANSAVATAPPDTRRAEVQRAREVAAAGQDRVCTWVRAEMDRTLPAEYRAP